MNIEIAAICDAATANDAGGRMNILGAFDRIFAKFPLVIPQCSAAFRLRYQRSEAVDRCLNDDVCSRENSCLSACGKSDP